MEQQVAAARPWYADLARETPAGVQVAGLLVAGVVAVVALVVVLRRRDLPALLGRPVPPEPAPPAAVPPGDTAVALARLLSEVESLRRTLDSHAEERRAGISELQAAVVRLHERIDDAQDRFAGRAELGAFQRLVEHLLEEVTRTVALLRERAVERP